MVYIKISEEFQNGAQELLNLFFPGNGFVFVDDIPEVSSCDILITLNIEIRDNGLDIKIRMRQGNRNLYSETARIDNETGAEKARTPVKVLLYNCLSHYTGRKLPWGSLTGIRPAKIVHSLLKEGLSPDDAYRKLINYYGLSDSKARLTVEVALNEAEYIRNAENKVSIYIGIPFCTSRCIYCSFPSAAIDRYEHLVSDYLKALYKEVQWACRWIREKNYTVDTVYIGGGTPTALPEKWLDYLLNRIVPVLPLDNIREYTVEAGRPDTLNIEKLRIIKNAGSTRISVNPQTMQDRTLKLIGRNHTTSQVIESFNMAREEGFDNINCDLIAGLPEETEKEFEDTLLKIGKLNPENVTVHTMSYKRASRLINEKDCFMQTDDETVNNMVELAGSYLRSIGMRPYYLYRQKNILANLENVGYAKPGTEGIYNMLIMEEVQTILAFGAGASSKIIYPGNRIERVFNVRNIEQYIQRIDEMIERKVKLLGS
ncbi:MAG: coproporphyrinogen dehydrogenase HemZ [Clostridiaceae bacterium]|jgi:oxygen-independent coproporphyrinogen-3 oxidase|nr:coproporphyrinogen dehydrogenase HemZ [Clostridiaceae bacterium]